MRKAGIEARLLALEQSRRGLGEVVVVMGDINGEPTEGLPELSDNDTLIVVTPAAPCNTGEDGTPCWKCWHYAECLAEVPPDLREEWEVMDRLERHIEEGRAWIKAHPEYQSVWGRPQAQKAPQEDTQGAGPPVAAAETARPEPPPKPKRRGIWPKGW